MAWPVKNAVTAKVVTGKGKGKRKKGKGKIVSFADFMKQHKPGAKAGKM
jgi:hypothetical protein